MTHLRSLLPTRLLATWIFAATCGGSLCMPRATAAEPESVARFESQVRPLLERYCRECHSRDHAEGEIDLSGFRNLADVHTQIPVWQKVRQMLDSDQMPPPDAPQPTEAERTLLKNWVRELLAGVARQRAGDPGPVMLRRLTNAEYNYTIRDLTGVELLDPTREFPVDGAAGEGFTNVGSGQGMSPSLVSKYLDAAKEVATHLVLLPDGVRFSPKTTQRDQTDELIARIQSIYRRYAAQGGGTTVNLDGHPMTTNQGGLLPVEAYLRATLTHREALRHGTLTLEKVAAGDGLSLRYLRTLWEVLTGEAQPHSPLLVEVRRHWQNATPEEASRLAEQIAYWQSALWKFNAIGHLGREGSPTAWMEAVSPLTDRHEVRVSLPDPADGRDVAMWLTASPFADADARDLVVWQQPRIEFPADESGRAHPPVLLRDVRQLVPRIEQVLAKELPRTASYLEALAQLRESEITLEKFAADHGLHPALLSRWARVTGIGTPLQRDITGHFGRKLERVQGYEAINGWGGPDLPSLLTNRSGEAIPLGTLTVPPRGVTVHPAPAIEAVVTWQSPVDARMSVRGLVADADDKCGNGVSWQLVLHSISETRVLLDGEFDDGGRNEFQVDAPVEVSTGDLVSLVVNPRGGNHSCDTTHVNLTLAEQGGQERVWDLAADIVDDVLTGNPHADSYADSSVWHFCGRPTTGNPPAPVVPQSSLAHWREAVVGTSTSDPASLARAVEAALTASADSLSEPDRQLRLHLLDWTGPLDWIALGQQSNFDASSDYGLDPAQFGRRPEGEPADPADLCLHAPHVLEVRLPAGLVRSGQLVATGLLATAGGQEGSVQLQILPARPERHVPSPAAPLLVREGTPAHARVAAALDDFRRLFPPALCYERIIPVDEVVTLTLFHREDHHLTRLMLDDAEAAELDRLWEELRFVSQEPLRLVVAFEQISEFATQDRPDLVQMFAPLRQPILDRAEAFRERMAAAEPSHVEAIIRFAERAWRSPLTSAQRQELQDVYQRLRNSEIAHEEAVRLLLARVLTAPAFLYKLETPGTGQEAAPVSGFELASRLSYFLWSSLPDEELRQAAESGMLNQDEVLRAQTRRMLRDPRTRRLAIHFACQWLHVRDFDQLVEKNEQLYPEFAELRGPIYEETVRFFEDLFRNDGSILEILGADHTFVTPALAGHYGLPSVADNRWQRVEGLRASGRGGILGMASVLASQSGASRTSPILRGTWVSETLLGERLPRPPAGVPTLPDAVPENLTARQLIELHSSAPGCATCHRKIDPYGFALEQFDTIGRSRPETADTRTTLIDGQRIEGLNGLRDYLLQDRREDFVRQFCRKLLGYALGREVQLSDEPLLDAVYEQLEAGGYRFDIAVEAIVMSPQFRTIRGRDQTADADVP